MIIDNKNYFKLLLVEILTHIASLNISFSLPLITYSLTKSESFSVFSPIVISLPYLILGFPFGYLIDKYNKKQVMLVVNIGRILCSLCVLFCIQFGYTLHNSVLLLVFLVETSFQFIHNVARSSVMPLLVSQEQLKVANSIVASCTNIFSILIPIISGLCLQFLGIKGIFTLDIVIFFCAYICTLLIKEPEHVRNTSSDSGCYRKNCKFRKQLSDLISTDIFKYLVIIFVVNLFGGNLTSFVLLFLQSHKHMSYDHMGFIYCFVGVGNILGATLFRYLFNQKNKIYQILFLLILDGIARMVIPILSNEYWIATILIVVFSAISAVNLFVITERQLTVSQRNLGKVTSIFKITAYCGRPISNLLSGFCVYFFDVKTAFIMCNIMYVLSLLMMFLKIDRLNRQDQTF